MTPKGQLSRKKQQKGRKVERLMMSPSEN
ncbi:hypothetical protein E2C01_083982 [Portunus trituberculatus]|uniref:Uncharacterized protein n=1 Tax=Portunus trituberculatus TaxID=210409 RepID=A0A5B7J9G8_PORTR|nr:hypothetical protein [Portunus trituberculatus]